jgi:hypothetical protein
MGRFVMKTEAMKAQEWLEALKADVARTDSVLRADVAKGWDESQHPRGSGGKFGAGGSTDSKAVTGTRRQHEVLAHAYSRGTSQPARQIRNNGRAGYAHRFPKDIQADARSAEKDHTAAAEHFATMGRTDLADLHANAAQAAREVVDTKGSVQAAERFLTASDGARSATESDPTTSGYNSYQPTRLLDAGDATNTSGEFRRSAGIY